MKAKDLQLEFRDIVKGICSKPAENFEDFFNFVVPLEEWVSLFFVFWNFVWTRT